MFPEGISAGTSPAGEPPPRCPPSTEPRCPLPWPSSAHLAPAGGRLAGRCGPAGGGSCLWGERGARVEDALGSLRRCLAGIEQRVASSLRIPFISHSIPSPGGEGPPPTGSLGPKDAVSAAPPPAPSWAS